MIRKHLKALEECFLTPNLYIEDVDIICLSGYIASVFKFKLYSYSVHWVYMRNSYSQVYTCTYRVVRFIKCV